MRSDITSIPVEEVFEPRQGCPICRMRNTLETRIVEYITGAAMMEPDVRTETNKQGFCYPHYQMMLQKSRRLSVALLLESHLAEVEKHAFSGTVPSSRFAKKQSRADGGCFVCGQVEWAMERMLETVCRQWEREREFRRLFEEQEAYCLPHLLLLTDTAAAKMNKKLVGDFTKAATGCCRRYLEALRGDVDHFNRMFDYRNTGEDADWGNSRDAIERAVWWLTSRDPR